MNKENRNEELTSLFGEGLNRLKEGKTLEGAEGAMTPLIKGLIEASLEGELDNHLEKSRPNRRNGKGSKTVKTSFGNVPIETPRDREGSFNPDLLPKRQRSLGPSLEQKILSLYSMGMSYRDICHFGCKYYQIFNQEA